MPRQVKSVPTLNALVMSLWKSVRSLGTLFGVLLFCALAFAIMGVQLFKVSDTP
jgi:hypothetical protein